MGHLLKYPYWRYGLPDLEWETENIIKVTDEQESTHTVTITK